MSTQPTDDESQIRAAFENYCRSFGWSKGRLARWQVDDESLPPAVRGAYMIGSVQQMWQSWCAGAKWGTPATGGEPVAWRYQDARGHYRYRGYVPRFDKDYAILKPIPLYTSPQPVREPLTQPEVVEGFCKKPHSVQYVSVFNAGVRFAERHHGIKEKA